MYFDVDEGFEGPEKCLHMIFSAGAGPCVGGGLRAVTRERWQRMLDLTRCQILSVMSGPHCDSFVLSESSLFVYADRIVLKTCGTTRLLLGIDDIISVAAERGLHLATVFYIRKNFTFPGRQPFPHTSFYDEKTYLDARFGGHSFVVGPLSMDHWFFYVADFAQGNMASASGVAPAPAPAPFIFEIKMHEIDPRAAAMFYRSYGLDAKGVTQASGLGSLVPGQAVDEHLFDPCGYSMNGLVSGGWYTTVHITPEDHCSYASFETNMPMADYQPLLAAVLDIFRPASFTAYLLAPHTSHAGLVRPDGYRLVGSSALPLLATVQVTTWTYIAEGVEGIHLDRMSRRLGRSASATLPPTPPPPAACSSPAKDSPTDSPVFVPATPAPAPETLVQHTLHDQFRPMVFLV